MKNEKEDFTFWAKYGKFATTEVLMYLTMAIGIGIGILVLN